MTARSSLMFPQFCQLIVQLINTTLRNTNVLARVMCLNCTFTGIEIILSGPWSAHEIVTLHSESFS
jgi:hypothetical protein